MKISDKPYKEVKGTQLVTRIPLTIHNSFQIQRNEINKKKIMRIQVSAKFWINEYNENKYFNNIVF